MTAQPSLFDPPTQRTSTLPHQGLSRIARECSLEAAHAAAPRRGRLQERYLAYLRAFGSSSDLMAAQYLGCPLSSVTSTRNGLIARAREQDEPETVVAIGKIAGEFGVPNTLWSLR
jgi:hypothetical protein